VRGPSRREALAAAALLAPWGCAAPGPRPVDFTDSTRNFGPGDYDRIYKAWSRHTRVVKDVGTVIELWAVLKGWEFRQAFVERYARVYGISDGEKRALYTAQLEASQRDYEFHVVAQMTEWRWNDLERPTSPWRLSLVDGAGVEVAPRNIQLLRLPDLYESQLFPDRTPFSRTYVVRFDRVAAQAAGFSGVRTGVISLRAMSPLARADLVWVSKANRAS
jgi:hypothetical protein